jgi:hypothetical protein
VKDRAIAPLKLENLQKSAIARAVAGEARAWPLPEVSLPRAHHGGRPPRVQLG